MLGAQHAACSRINRLLDIDLQTLSTRIRYRSGKRGDAFRP